MIATTKGPMDESALVKKCGTVDTTDEETTWVEFYLGDELVHRSVHVNLKKGLVLSSTVGVF
jgi:hypothetical protein